MKKTVTVVAIVFALSCLLLLLSPSMPAPALAQELPDLTITAIKPYHYEWSEEYDIAKGYPWFNLKNYVEVTVKNNRNATVEESFNVTLYADDERIRRETVEGLPADGVIDVTFEWIPEGEEPLSWTDSAEGAILFYTDTNRIYTLKALVDKDNKILPENEKEQEVAWNGYMADAPLENREHDSVNGGIVYTTGDGEYRSYESGDDGTRYNTYYDINYDLEIADGAKLARLYIYYTWSKPKRAKEPKAPKICITLKTPSGNIHDLNMEKSYNDIKGDLPDSSYKYHAWGTYAYDITDYVKESGAYVVSVTNRNSGSDSDFATEFSFAPPAILVVYEDRTSPKREYWINEGADILMGGRDKRSEGGFLDLEDCLNHAVFPGEHLDLEVEKAVLGVVAPWADDSEDDVIYFNGRKLGRGLYNGYSNAWRSSKDIKGISMCVGADEAQMGVAAIDVTDDLEDYDNEVIQGDDGDNMMSANAFLVITYEEEEEEEQIPPDIIPQEPVDTEINNIECESRTFSISIDQSVDIVWQINGTEVQTDEDVTEASYTNASTVLGTWNVSAIGTSRETGLSDMHTWIWNVTAAVGTTPTSKVNITSTPSPTPAPPATPASSVSATPTPTSTPTTATPRPEEKKKAEAEEETKAPGFELAMSSFILIAVAYLLRKQRKI